MPQRTLTLIISLLLLMCFSRVATVTAQAPVIRHIISPDSSMTPELLVRLNNHGSVVLHNYSAWDSLGFTISLLNNHGELIKSRQLVHGQGNSGTGIYQAELLSNGDIGILGTVQDLNQKESWFMTVDSSSLAVKRMFRFNTMSQSGLQSVPIRFSQTQSGDLLFAGSMASLSPAVSMAFASKMDLSGHVLWTQTINQSFSSAHSIIEYAPNRYAIAGNTSNSGATNPFLVALDGQGNIIWGKLMDLGGSMSFAMLSAGSGAEIHLWSSMVQDTGLALDLINTIFLAIDSSGNLQNMRFFDDFAVKKVVQLSDKSYAGLFYDHNTYSQGFGFQGLLKTDPLGNLQYIHQFDSGSTVAGSSAIEGLDLEADNKGMIHLTGRGQSAGQTGYNSIYMTTDAQGFLPCFNYDASSSSQTQAFTSQSYLFPDTQMVIFTDSFGVWMNNISFTDTVICTGICVWPGDGDGNGIANNEDVLNIGVAYASTGPVRGAVSNAWSCHTSEAWSQAFNRDMGGKGYENSDCNGDGVINENDTTAIALNYGSISFKKAGGPQLFGTIHPNLSIKITEDSLNYGDTCYADLLMGTDSLPVDSVYGIAFKIMYDNSLIDSGSVWIEYDSSWIGEPTQTINMTKDFWHAGAVDGVIVRKDGQNVSGYGRIAKMGFVIIDNIERKQYYKSLLPVQVGPYKAITLDGDTLNLVTNHDTVTILSNLDDNLNVEDMYGIRVFPNPTSGNLTIEAGETQITGIILRDINGRPLHLNSPEWEEISEKDIVKGTYYLKEYRRLELQLQEHPPGIYILSMETSEGIAHKKIILSE